MKPHTLPRPLNGLEKRTYHVILAVEEMARTTRRAHVIEARLHWFALARACACAGGTNRVCEACEEAGR